MKIWILYKDSANSVKPEAYEINRFLDYGKSRHVDVQIIKPEEVDLVVTREDRKSVLLNGSPVDLPDCLLPRMGAGTTYFALAVIRHLERLGVYSVNSSQSIETVKDKLYTHQILAENNLPVPRTMLVKFPVDVDLVEKNLGFPVVVKTLSGSQGSGVFLSEDKRSFHDLTRLIEATNKNANIILQEFVAASMGMDLRVFLVGGRIVACMKRTARPGEFKANFSTGGSVESFPLTPEIEWLATQTSHILGLDVAGIDLLFDKDHYKVCEANSSPGFEGLEKSCHVDIPEEIFNFISLTKGISKDF